MKFLRNLLASFLALVIFFTLGILIMIGAIAIIGNKDTVTVADNSVLHLKLDKPISEVEFDNPLAEFDIFPTAPNTIGLVQLKEAIRQARDDKNIEGIYLEAPEVKGGMAALEEIRDALIDFKSSGKFIASFGEYFSEGGYYLATAADKIYLHPEGDVELNGLNATLFFFKGLFDKLEIEPQIFRVGDFKSAVEPFTRKDMSSENRMQLTAMLSTIYGNVIDNMSTSRGIPPNDFLNISENMLARTPEEALEYRLIDSLLYRDQVVDVMKEQVGAEDKDLELVTYNDYKQSYNSYKSSKNEVAVIVASGNIVSGKGDVNTIGSENFSEEIRKARENEKVKAIVVRINSPGGSFIASDVMWREIKLARRVKPVIASMSDVAASGGYYMAMACDTIVAQPNTITGSIGIFGIILNLKGFLNNKLGVTTDEVKTGELSSLYNVTRPLTAQEKRIIQQDVENGYKAFVTKAAAGRNMSVEALEEVASGRVWTGDQAMKNGLIDILGDFEQAIAIAAEKAGVADDYKVRYYPKHRSIFEEFVKTMEEDNTTKALNRELGVFYPYLKSLQDVKEISGIQARMLYEFRLN